MTTQTNANYTSINAVDEDDGYVGVINDIDIESNDNTTFDDKIGVDEEDSYVDIGDDIDIKSNDNNTFDDKQDSYVDIKSNDNNTFDDKQDSYVDIGDDEINSNVGSNTFDEITKIFSDTRDVDIDDIVNISETSIIKNSEGEDIDWRVINKLLIFKKYRETVIEYSEYCKDKKKKPTGHILNNIFSPCRELIESLIDPDGNLPLLFMEASKMDSICFGVKNPIYWCIAYNYPEEGDVIERLGRVNSVGIFTFDVSNYNHANDHGYLMDEDVAMEDRNTCPGLNSQIIKDCELLPECVKNFIKNACIEITKFETIRGRDMTIQEKNTFFMQYMNINTMPIEMNMSFEQAMNIDMNLFGVGGRMWKTVLNIWPDCPTPEKFIRSIGLFTVNIDESFWNEYLKQNH